IACFFGAWLCVRLAATTWMSSALINGLLVWCITGFCATLFLAALFLGGMLPNFRALLASPMAQSTRRNPALFNARVGELATRVSFAAVALGVSSLLGVVGALCGAAAGRYAVRQDLKRGIYRPSYRREEELVPTTPATGEELPPEAPRH